MGDWTQYLLNTYATVFRACLEIEDGGEVRGQLLQAGHTQTAGFAGRCGRWPIDQRKWVRRPVRTYGMRKGPPNFRPCNCISCVPPSQGAVTERGVDLAFSREGDRRTYTRLVVARWVDAGTVPEKCAQQARQAWDGVCMPAKVGEDTKQWRR